MTKRDVRAECKRMVYLFHTLNYFYFDRELTEIEKKAIVDIFGTEVKFSSKVSQAGFIFMAFKDEDNVRWRLEYQHLEKYIARNHEQYSNAYHKEE